jgi:hypothetical protein
MGGGRLVKVGSVMGGSIFVTLDKKKDSLIWEDFLKLGLELEESHITHYVDIREFDIIGDCSEVIMNSPLYVTYKEGTFRTSLVKEIYNYNFIRTFNSIYFIETKDWVRSKRIDELIR